MKLTQSQANEILALTERTPWGDVDGGIQTIDAALKIAMQASEDEFLAWEEAEAEGELDEFDPALPISGMPQPLRFALVARLVRSIALSYGVSTEIGGLAPGTLCGDPSHVATPLRESLRILASQTGPSYERRP